MMKPRVLDLFSGCGGFSLGFSLAGYEIIGGVDVDPIAHHTHSSHFPPKVALTRPHDIRRLEASAAMKGFGQENPGDVDIVIGGPPCQPFTRVGRAKLREVSGDVRAHVADHRVPLYSHFLRFLAELNPTAFVMENVQYITSFAGRNIAEEVAVSAEDLGYNVRYAILNAAWYGVPQMRERLFIIGIRKRSGVIPKFPVRTHSIELPIGYTTSRMSRPDYAPVRGLNGHFVKDVASVRRPEPAVIASEAFEDLPVLSGHLKQVIARRGPQALESVLSYRPQRPSKYARIMRSWPGFQTFGLLTGHVIRSTPRDYETFKRMRPGDQYPEAFAIAERRFSETVSGMRSPPEPRTKAYIALRASIVPPYDSRKFPNKWRKMEPNFPGRTVTAHLGKDTYSHIHYDSAQSRTISVREAARLQSFPDGFTFSGRMNAAFRQIGDAVPPLLAYAVAASLARQLAGHAELGLAVSARIIPEHSSRAENLQPSLLKWEAASEAHGRR